MIKTYDIRFNGSVPYVVTLDYKAKIARISQQLNKMPLWCYVPIPVEIAFLQVFVPSGQHSKGHSLLFLLSKPSVMDRTNTYLYMSVYNESITLFRTSEKINQYFSELNGSDVAYAISIGNSNIYFMTDLVYLPKHMFHDARSVNEIFKLFHVLQSKAQRFMDVDVLCSHSERFSVENLKNIEK